MLVKRSTFFALILLSGLLSISRSALAQNYQTLTFRIDSLANVGLPKSALKMVDQLDDLARKNNNAPQQIRAVIYRMTFQSYLEENALTAIINRLKSDISKANYPVKPVLQSLLAEMYWNYYEGNRYKFGQRSRLDKPDADFTKWDLRTIVNETSQLYSLSLNDAEKEQNTPVGILDGVLQGDKSTRYLRPTLYDLLVQRAFDFFLSDEAGLPEPRLPFSLNAPSFFSDSRTFANLSIKTTDTASTQYKGIKYLQQATSFHLKGLDEEALADIDLQRLKFLYDKSNAEHKDSLYLATLKQIAAAFSAKPISAEALMLQGQYYQGLDSLTIAHGFFKSAVAAFPRSLGGKNAATLIREIEEKELSATVEDVSTPGKPLLALVNYRNVNEAKVSVYHLSIAQVQQLGGKDAWYKGYDLEPSAKVFKFLSQLQPVQAQQLSLPDPHDFRKHSAEFKIGALPVGYYVILIKEASSDKKGLVQITDFMVTHLAYSARVNPNGQTELRIVDRDSGLPMPGVRVSIYKWDDVDDNKSTRTDLFSGSSDRDGRYIFDNRQQEQYTIALANKEDSYIDDGKSFYGVTESYNDEKPQTNVVLFTDRQIYRPGQTIYFKGLMMSTLNGKSVILPQTPVTINFFDLNFKPIDSVKLKTNDFGSVQGSFIIPQTVANGLVHLVTTFGSIDLHVEEYKRPTFQVEFAPVTAAYKTNDMVKLKGKVTSFSGYGLSNAKVAYHITGLGIPRYSTQFKYRGSGQKTNEIKTDTIHTDDQGAFEVDFKPVVDTKNLQVGAYNYSVDADVTDASGETRSANTLVIVSDNPLKIDAAMPQKLLPGDTAIVSLKLTNLYGKAQKGTINIKAYALIGPGQVFKNRLWDSPDQFILKKDEFKQAFPAYAWKNEDDYNKWEQAAKVIDVSVNANDTIANNLDLGALKKQASGVYKVIINARDAAGDTTSLTQFINVVTVPGKAQKMEDWVIPVVTQVKAGGQAEFLIGINKPATVLMEKYDGARLLSSESLALDGVSQQKITIPGPATEKNSFAVQFLMVNDNRVYHYHPEIKVKDTVKKLNIRFLTFRNKLQPGEKEQWKLEVSAANNEKPSAEMLATLYDASLDDILPMQYWKTDFDEEIYGPNYFEWTNQELAKEDVTRGDDGSDNYSLIEREYEQLYLFGYNYYGGDNRAYQDYLLQIDDLKEAAKSDKKIAAKYFANAALVKNGYDITGRVVSEDGENGIRAVKISIKNTGISTLSNSQGYFKIRVPLKGILVFSYKRINMHYHTKQINTTGGANIIVELTHTRLRIYGILDPGQKSLKGDKNEDIETNEPVGNASVKSVRFAPPVVKADREAEFGYNSAIKADTIKKAAILGGNVTGQKPITVRKNFNETAFFYPQLLTNEKGEILIDFTIPEALTRWKFRGFAYTRDLGTGYIENTVVTEKQLSISANTPRFLREGDTITISARLANLTGSTLKGKVQMRLFNALNMQPVSIFVNAADAGQQFEIAGGTTKAISFRLLIPAGLDALTYRLTADAGQFTDGEENTLPVLPNRTLVTESMPMMVRAGQTRNFTFDKLINQNSPTLKNKTLTLEYTQNPAWYAVQALPYMMEFPYECSEQIFSRYYANSLATNIVNKLPAVKQVFDRWKSGNSSELLSNLEKNQDLKSTLIEETPWLKDALSETEQKKRIALLFDLNKMSNELALNLEKLKKKQLPDGGFPWFGGDGSDRFITQHIVEGIGELYHLGIAGDQPELKQIADSAIKYQDRQLLADDKLEKKNKNYATRTLNDIEIQAWFARSYLLNEPMNADLKKLLTDYLRRSADQWKFRNVYEQGMIALTLQRYKIPAVTAQIERSLLETAQQSDDLGMYWAANLQGYYWYQSPVETQSLLIELFTEAGDNTKAVDEMKIWLLRNKQTSDWETTKATAAACYALLLKGSDMLSNGDSSVIKLDGKPLEILKPEIKKDAGTGYLKTSWADEQIKPNLGKVEIKNNSKTISWGAMHWQYFENLDKITSAQTNIQLERKYFIQKQTDAGPVLTAVDNAHLPKTGDLLKVVVYLKADRDFEYVQLKDLRPAGTEPVEAISTYKYQDGLWYYQVSKDVATNFFISYLNKGNYVFEYQLRVTQPGNFSTGITTIQCMYAPEFNAHSEGGRMTIKP